MPAASSHFRFGPFDLELDERRLLKHGTVVALRPRTFDLLVALIDRAGHLVTKDALLDRVWPGVVVEEAVLHVQVSTLRKVLGSEAIATVPRSGYRFTLPVTRLAPVTLHNLPSQLTSFIGREHELAQLADLMKNHRLVTLTGAGGAGKTRLAVELASRIFPEFPDGAWLVELAALSDAQLVPGAVVQALGVKEKPGKTLVEAINSFLSTKRMLLVFDNAEHLLDGCARLIDEVLRRTAEVTVLVTSRERLGMTGELTYRVPSLTVPDRQDDLTPTAALGFEGVRLFVDRARLQRSDFDLVPENVAAVASICARLEGIPLAIELAAPRIRSMSVAELSRRLDHRFALLTDGSRAALARHRTLRSMIDWSYDLLSDVEKAMLRRLSVFSGGWSLASAEHACTDGAIERFFVIELLTSLIDKSLIVADEREGRTRYSVLETVRQYAWDRLRESGEESTWRRRHVACFVALSDERHAELYGPGMKAGIDRLIEEQDNFRAALSWCCACGAEEGLRLLGNLSRLWRYRSSHGLAEGREWAARMLAAVPAGRATRDRARVSYLAGVHALSQCDHAPASALLLQSLSLYREVDELRGVTNAQTALANLALDQASYAEAETWCRTALASARVIEDRWLVVVNLGNLGVALNARGDSSSARALFDEALTMAREIGDLDLLSSGLKAMGNADCDQGLHELARVRFTESITMTHDVGDYPGTADALDGFANIALATDSPVRAVRLLAAVDALREEVGAGRDVEAQRRYERMSTTARAALDEDALERATLEGRAMNVEDAVQYALERE